MRFYNIISQVCVSKSTIRSVCIALFALPTGIFLANGIMLPTWIVRLGAGWAGPEVVTIIITLPSRRYLQPAELFIT